jgi:hypothetical protein
MHLTRGGRVQRPLTCGPSEWLAGTTLHPPASFIGGDALQETVEWNPRAGVSGGHAPWPDDHVARPANNWQVTDLIKSVIAPGTPINTPLPMEFTHHSLLVGLHM